ANPQFANGGRRMPGNPTLLVDFLLLVFGLLLERRARWRGRGRAGRLWCRRWSHSWLRQQALMITLECLHCQLELRGRGQSRHAQILTFLVIVKPFALFQVCSSGQRVFLCRLHVWII